MMTIYFITKIVQSKPFSNIQDNNKNSNINI